MPQPPILPLIDWRALFAAGLAWRPCLDIAEQPEHRTELLGSYGGFHPLAGSVERLRALGKPVRVVAIAESWCGDVRRHIPVLQKLADAGGPVEVRYITRRQDLGAFARLLTNGGEAIPKAVFLSADFVETGNWGPMPENGRRVIAQGRAANDIPGSRTLVAAQYAADPQRRGAEAEILDRIAIAATTSIATATGPGAAASAGP
jgi:thiol-disulfide isomerase/thioredoxin